MKFAIENQVGELVYASPKACLDLLPGRNSPSILRTETDERLAHFGVYRVEKGPEPSEFQTAKLTLVRIGDRVAEQVSFNEVEPEIVRKKALGAKRKFMREVRDHAETLRRSIIDSDGPGKIMEYLTKQVEAQKIVAGATSGLPFAEARVRVTGTTLEEVAAEWSTKAAAWHSMGALITEVVDWANLQVDGLANKPDIHKNLERLRPQIEAKWPK